MQELDPTHAVNPFVKWVGGKRRSLPKLMRYVPRNISTYVEPFVGGGAMFFALKFKRALINDSNPELMAAYKVLKDKPYELIELLKTFKFDKENYMAIRSWDKEKDFSKRSDVEHAARLIYLLKTCFNGLYRVSSKNYFNTPMGKFSGEPKICNEESLLAVHNYLKQNDTEIRCCSYVELFKDIPDDAFVYLDPPYAPLSKTSSFTSYQSQVWNDSAQRTLAFFCTELDKRGIRFMQSNSTAPICFELYKKFNITTLNAKRYINSDGAGRGDIKELVITNYDVDGVL